MKINPVLTCVNTTPLPLVRCSTLIIRISSHIRLTLDTKAFHADLGDPQQAPSEQAPAAAYPRASTLWGHLGHPQPPCHPPTSAATQAEGHHTAGAQPYRPPPSLPPDSPQPPAASQRRPAATTYRPPPLRK